MKIKLNPLRSGILIFALAVVLWMIIRSFIPASYKLHASDILTAEIESVSLLEFFENFDKAEMDILIIDSREAAAYEQSHLDNTVNIPVTEIMKNENLRKLGKKEVWLIGGTEMMAHDLGFLLLQMGYQIRVVEASYHRLSQLKDDFNPALDQHSIEKKKYNYPKYIKKAEGSREPFEIDNRQEINMQGGC